MDVPAGRPASARRRMRGPHLSRTCQPHLDAPLHGVTGPTPINPEETGEGRGGSPSWWLVRPRGTDKVVPRHGRGDLATGTAQFDFHRVRVHPPQEIHPRKSTSWIHTEQRGSSSARMQRKHHSESLVDRTREPDRRLPDAANSDLSG